VGVAPLLVGPTMELLTDKDDSKNSTEASGSAGVLDYDYS